MTSLNVPQLYARNPHSRLTHGQSFIMQLQFFQFESHQFGYSNLPPASDLSMFEHPKTKDTEKYFVGDRFHNAQVKFKLKFKMANQNKYFIFQFPHKSPLCNYHDINLNPELHSAKTSSQESLNHSKNQKRLR